MLEMKQIVVEGEKFSALTIQLPKTTLLILSNDVGYIMCGALDVAIFNQPHLKTRKVVCARAVGVKTMDDLLAANLESVSTEAERMGMKVGMPVKTALLKMK